MFNNWLITAGIISLVIVAIFFFYDYFITGAKEESIYDNPILKNKKTVTDNRLRPSSSNINFDELTRNRKEIIYIDPFEEKGAQTSPVYTNSINSVISEIPEEDIENEDLEIPEEHQSFDFEQPSASFATAMNDRIDLMEEFYNEKEYEQMQDGSYSIEEEFSSEDNSYAEEDISYVNAFDVLGAPKDFFITQEGSYKLESITFNEDNQPIGVNNAILAIEKIDLATCMDAVKENIGGNKAKFIEESKKSYIAQMFKKSDGNENQSDKESEKEGIGEMTESTSSNLMSDFMEFEILEMNFDNADMEEEKEPDF